MDRTKGFLSLLVSGIIFGSFVIWIRLLAVDFTIYQQVAFRNIIGLFFALILILFTKPKISFDKIKIKHLVIFSIIFPIAAILYSYSFIKTKIILGIFSFYIGSILSSLGIGRVVFKEKITIQKIISLALTLLGLILFVYPDKISNIDLGMVLGFLAGLVDTIAHSFRKHLGGKMDRVVLTAFPLIGGVLISSMFMVINGEFLLPHISTTSWLVGIIFGILLFLVNYLMFIGFSNYDLNIGTIVISSELLFAPLFAIVAFQEFPEKNEMIGGVFILFAIVAANSKLKKRSIVN